LVVLINAGSASSAEIVSGILRENKRALLAGQRTYGKGTVLSGQPFDRGQFDDIVYYKTFAQFYFPSGRSYHVTGLSPDVEIPSLEAKSATFRESDLPYYNIVKQTGISQSQGQAMYSDHNPYDPADFKTCATQKLTVEEPTLAAAALLGCLAAKKSN
jgi:C-terminal processing protease CtpA/Prc